MQTSQRRSQLIDASVPRHAQRRRTRVCGATLSGAALSDAGPAYPAWQLGRATAEGVATFCATPL
jgi:hypothetical protein